MLRSYLARLYGSCCAICCGCCCNGGKSEPSDYEEIGADMSNRYSPWRGDRDSDPPTPEDPRLRPTGSFDSSKATDTHEVPQGNRRRHSSPALAPRIVLNSPPSPDELAAVRRKSYLSACSFKKSDYQELPEIAENSEAEAGLPATSSESEWLGMLHFSVRTLPDHKRITVDVEKADDLPRRGTVESYFPIVQLYIHPADQTKCSKPAKSRSPIFKESFNFDLDFSTEECRVIVLSVYDHDHRDQPIGHVTCRLFREDMATEHVRHYQIPLSRISILTDNIGAMLISATYNQPTRELQVTVLRGRDVKVTSNAQDMYVKANMVCAGEKVQSKKSKPIARVANPCFKHQFAFVVPSHFMDDITMEIKIEVPSVLKKNRLVGRVVINPFTRHSDHDLSFWQRVINEDLPCRKWFTMTL